MKKNIFYPSEENEIISIINESNFDQIIVLVDAKTNGYCFPIFKQLYSSLTYSFFIVIPDGEKNKNIDIVQYIWNELLLKKVTTNSLLINIGGGVLSDIGGFVAATYKRGIEFINIPTTLLSMADASIGGKTGINFNDIKNCIGSFHFPFATYINPIFFKTLSERNILNGSIEMIKHALLHSEILWNEMKHFSINDFQQIKMIRQTISIKQEIVALDKFDKNIRQALNLGHTIGHAIESYSYQTEQPLLHGEAILLGLIHEMKLSEEIFSLSKKNRKELEKFKEKLFPSLNFSYSINDILPYLIQDKKNTTTLKMSLLKSVGDYKIGVDVNLSLLEKSFQVT